MVKVLLGERWDAHAETFGILSGGKTVPLTVQYASVGGHVLVTDNLEVSRLVGWGLDATSPACFSNIGLGWQYWAGGGDARNTRDGVRLTCTRTTDNASRRVVAPAAAPRRAR
ncbi:MAG: hypothetical protein FJ284_13760 [Planctomycetes bacterium]|nr:hypothetical protein [Planctomycetota bacterium]